MNWSQAENKASLVCVCKEIYIFPLNRSQDTNHKLREGLYFFQANSAQL